jgi:hypothetical protein
MHDGIAQLVDLASPLRVHKLLNASLLTADKYKLLVELLV